MGVWCEPRHACTGGVPVNARLAYILFAVFVLHFTKTLMSGAPTTPEGTLGTKCDGAPPLVETEVGRTDALTEGAAFIHRAHSQGGSPTFGRPDPPTPTPTQATGLSRGQLPIDGALSHRSTGISHNGRKGRLLRSTQCHCSFSLTSKAQCYPG